MSLKALIAVTVCKFKIHNQIKLSLTRELPGQASQVFRQLLNTDVKIDI